jgi:hypothetical protein
MAETQPSNDRPSDVKSCTSCGLDVTNRKRTKDAQGRYFCEDCVAKAKAARAAANPPPQIKANKDAVASASKAGGDDNAFLLDMGGSAMAIKGSTPCPECSRALTEGTVICTGCGYNLQTGKRLAVKVTKAKAAKGEGAGGGESLTDNPFALGMIAIIVLVGLIGGTILVPELAFVALPVLLLYNVTVFVSVVFSAFRADGVVWGLICLLGCGLGPLVWLLVKCQDERLKYLYGAAIVASMVARGSAYLMTSGAVGP